MADHIITPRQSRWEKLKSEITAFSPQVKQGLIAATVTLLVAIAGCVTVYSENSRLKAKVHDLELEVLPFRNLAVQQFNKADAESLRKLAESMATLHEDYSTQLNTINTLRQQIEDLKGANEKLAREFSAELTQQTFIPLADENKRQFVSELSRFFRRWPSITNVVLIVDDSEKRRRSWTQQIKKIVSDAKLPVHTSAGANVYRGRFDLAICYGLENELAAREITHPFIRLFRPPITISAVTNQAEPIRVFLMGDPLFDTNGVIHFE